jgi:hypothetical protein
MDLAHEINALLDELSKQIKLGDQIKIAEIKNRLNKKTRQGEIVENIFTNDYYVNNMMLDKREKQMQ